MLWLVLYPILFVFIIFPAVQDMAGAAMYFIALALQALPTLLVISLSILGIIQVFKKKRTVLNSLGHLLAALIASFALMIFFFFLTFATFGFS